MFLGERAKELKQTVEIRIRQEWWPDSACELRTLVHTCGLVSRFVSIAICRIWTRLCQGRFEPFFQTRTFQRPISLTASMADLARIPHIRQHLRFGAILQFETCASGCELNHYG